MAGVKGLIVVALMAGAPALVSAMDLQAETVEAWQAYVHDADSRMQARLDGQHPFLWTDEAADRAARVRRGEIVVAPMAGGGTYTVPKGLIHHWIGATFIPGATIDSLVSVLHDYDRYKDYYKPFVVESKAFTCTSTDQEFSMVWKRRVMFATMAIQSRYQGHDVAVDERRGYNIAGTTKVQQIEDYGHAGARALAPDTGSGFVWRLHSIVRYEEREGGVYLEVEAIALSRDIPVALASFVKPMVNHLSVNSLTSSLRQTRDAVSSSPIALKQPAQCQKKGRPETIATGGGY